MTGTFQICPVKLIISGHLEDPSGNPATDDCCAYLQPEQVERSDHHALLLLWGGPVGAAVHPLAHLAQQQVQLLKGHRADVHHEGNTLPNGPL